MPQNFGSNFLRGFGGTFPNTFNTSFRYGLQKQEDEAEKQKALEYQKDQQDILTRLIAGKKQDPNLPQYRGASSPNSAVPLSNEDRIGLISRADKDTLSRYNTVADLLNPKVETEKPFEWGGNLYGWKTENGKKTPDFSSEIKKKPEEKQKVAWVEESGEGKTEYKGYEDPNADEKSPFVKLVPGSDGKTHKMIITDVGTTYKPKVATNSDGSKKEIWGEDFAKEIDKRISTLYRSNDIMKATEKSEFSYFDPITGRKISINHSTAKEMYDSAKNQLDNFINTQLGQDTVYDNISSQVKGIDPNSAAPTLWKTILENYKDKAITEKQFQEWRYRYISEFGFDPVSRFGMK